MKKLVIPIIPIILLLTLITSCEKDSTNSNPTTSQATCNINITYLKDVNWNHLTGVLADLKFSSNGIYYENNTNDGNWTLINNCDSIYVTRPSNNFYYKIKSLSLDSLILINPVFGEVKYYK